MPAQATDEALHILLDKQEITEILYLYARGWDRYDPDTVRSCFHADSTHRHGGFEGLSADFVKFGVDATTDVLRQSHMISNPVVVVKGDVAISECSFLAFHRRPAAGGGEEDMFLKGRYVDRFERREGAWKIAHRMGVHDFERVLPPADQSLPSSPSDQLSKRYPDDVLYGMLAGL